MDQNNQKQVNIEIKPEIAKGSYSNLAVITHSPTEFILDFIEMVPGVPKPEVVSRIIMTPEHAKRLLQALNDNVNKYEASNGKIVLHQGPQGGTAMPFGPAGQA
ncbi:MAG: DUF3467 domain-containing protein [Bacteroidales bacterium]|jgi:hypothetical protein|nr:DUF3467 domain-containing protein [Bacteroidales bacterium]MCI2122345.1 DUF3467 domain-containing protein [Bacteroidales bacterium]MCI2146185.1 DUF3467 domain-containing protein [Bacteroidales bacterium]